MRNTLAMLGLLGLSLLTGYAQATPCPRSAVFLVIENQVRGYPTRGNGPTVPCQILQGPLTTLSTAKSISFSRDGSMHVLQFLTNGAVPIFNATDQGNVAPRELEMTETNDLIGLATDARDVDFILSRRGSAADVTVFLPGQTLPYGATSAPGFQQSGGIAVDSDNNLVIGGYDVNYNPLISTFNSSADNANLVRQLSGSNLGIYPGTFANFGQNSISLAVDPVSGELYVYNYSESTGQRQISVFAAHASGNTAPTRVIAGSATRLGPPGDLNSKIAVSNDGRLYVAEANNTILVFSPGVSGNVAPAQIIQDSTIGTTSIAQGGIGVRSCLCCQ